MNSTLSSSEIAGVIERPAFPVRPKSPSLETLATRGAFWSVLFSGLNKLVALGAQVGLAWFLLPKDMGIAGIALAISGIVSVASGTIPAILLIQHKGSLEERAGEIFWFSLTTSSLATLVLVGLSPLAGHFFKDSRIVPIILILAVAIPLMALPSIYSAQLYRDLRFRVLAQVKFGEGLIRNAGAVILAALGFGAYSLVLPLPAASLYTAVNCRLLAGRIPIGRPHPWRWAALLAPVSWLIVLSLAEAGQMNGTIFVIGAVRDPAVTGFYTWGLMLSSQAIFLLAINLHGVLFPVLSKLNHLPLRQEETFRRACQILILIIAPVAALQIVLAHPVVELLFHNRWLPAVPVVQWLSLGMATQPFSILGTSLLLARGQYRLLALTVGAIVILVTAASLLGALWGEQAEIARCTGLALFFANLGFGWVASRELKSKTRFFFWKLSLPVLVLIPLLLTGILLTFLLRGWSSFISIPAISAILMVLYGFGISILAPVMARDLIRQLRSLSFR